MFTAISMGMGKGMKGASGGGVAPAEMFHILAESGFIILAESGNMVEIEDDYSAIISPDTFTITQGDSANFTITLTNTSGAVQISTAIVASGMSTGVTIDFNTQAISTNDGTATGTVHVAADADTVTADAFVVTVTAPSGQHTDGGTVTVESGFDVDAVDFFDRVAVLGTISDGAKAAYNSAVAEIKAETGLWTKVKEIYFGGGTSFAASLVKLKEGTSSNDLTNHNFVSGDYTQLRGWKGNGTTKYFSTNYTPTSDGLTHTNQSYGVFLLGEGDETGTLFSGIGLGDGANLYLAYSGGAVAFVGASLAGSYGDGLHSCTVDGSNAKVYCQGELIDTQATSGSADPSAELLFGDFNGSFKFDKYLRGYFAADNLTAAEMKVVSDVFERLHGRLAALSRTPLFCGFGNSLTDIAIGYGALASDAAHDYCGLVGAALGLSVQRAGISSTALYGVFTSTSSRTAGRTSFLSRITRVNPTKLCINYATNDICSADSNETDVVYGDQIQKVFQMAKRFQLPAADIVAADATFIQTYSGQGDDARRDAFVAITNTKAAIEGIAVVPVLAAMISGGGASLMIDAFHPGDAGHAVLAAPIVLAF